MRAVIGKIARTIIGLPLATWGVLAAAALLNICVWSVANRPDRPPDWPGQIAGLSFSPFQADQSPIRDRLPSPGEIAADLARLDGLTPSIRTYSVDGVLGEIPALAARRELRVTAGAWISADAPRNRAETDRLIAIAERHANVDRVLVGNETQLRSRIDRAGLIAMIRKVRGHVTQPVSTAEPWHVWLDHPDLAAEVDFLAVHALPYWEGVPVEDAVAMVMQRYRELTAAFPDKPIVLAEVGWPSHGPRIGGAHANRINQARFLREFMPVADAAGLDYYVVEAFDQVWKVAEEGAPGAAWGTHDARRAAKFPWQGPVYERPSWPQWALVAAVLGLIPALLYLAFRPSLTLTGRTVFALLCQLAGTGLAWAMMVPTNVYLVPGAMIAWAILVLAQWALFAGLGAEAGELTESLWNRPKRRRFDPAPLSERRAWPKVSIHLPCRDEPPEMVCEVLAALDRLAYPNLEIIVVVNNTPDPDLWRPVADCCRQLGSRFKFLRVDKLDGFKAGALNYALAHTAADAELIGIIDSDYLVDRDWLRRLVPIFDDSEVGLVQAPQDYRDGDRSPFKRMCFWEYAAFFRIGMVERNEADAIIQHGTMTLVRKSDVVSIGGWAEWCITEDAELGLRLLAHGKRSAYVRESFGRGLIPDSLRAFKQQRFRWVYGAVQILKRHWRLLFTGNGSKLDTGQRYHFVAGWLPWFADALGIVFTLAAIFWSTMMIVWPKATGFPIAAFLVPALAAFLFRQLRTLWLYQARVGCGTAEYLGAMVAGLALSHTVAKAVLWGLFTRRVPFRRTPKQRAQPAILKGLTMAAEEAVILAMLLAAIGGIAVTHDTTQLDTVLWLLMLAMQAVPYAAAMSLSMINSLPAPAWWRLRRRATADRRVD